MNLIVLGPRSVGKSSVSKVLARRLELVYVSSDVLMDESLRPYGGLDGAISDGRTGLVARTGFRIVEDVLDRDGVVFDLAGGSLLNDDTLPGDRSVRSLLEDETAFVVGLVPFESTERTVELLFSRERERPHFSDVDDEELREKVREDFHRLMTVLPSVADTLVYTGDDGVEPVVDRVAKAVT